MNLLAPSSSHLQPGASSSIWTPSASSYSAPITPLQTRADSSDNLLDPLNLQHTSQMSSQVHSNSQGDPIFCNESCTDSDDSGNSDDVMIVDYEKPWNERSPIQLSSAVEDTDSDICITGMTYATDSVKKERKRKHKHKKKENRDKDKSRHHERSRKRQADHSTEASKTKKRRRSKSRSRSAPRTCCDDNLRSRSSSPSQDILRTLSRPRSPIRMRLYKSPHYSHKKFGYDRLASREDRHQQGSRRSLSHTDSRHSHRSHSSSGSQSDSDPGSESRHVTYTSHKHRDKGRHASIEILEYRKKSSKHKKNKKHKKDKKKTAADTGTALCESDEELTERSKEKNTDLTSTRRHKRSKSKKKKSKHKSHKHKENTAGHHSDSPVERKSLDSTPEHPDNAEPDGKRISADVSQQVARIFKEIAEIKQHSTQNTQNFTSDSETDSDVDVENVSEKRKSLVPENQNRKKKKERKTEGQDSQDSTTVSMPLEKDECSVAVDKSKDSVDVSDSNTAVFHTTGFEFVELPSDQAASVDMELANITKSLDENVDNEMEDSSKPKPFKKHPYGHKKSGKHSTGTVTTIQGTGLGQSISALAAVQANSPCKRMACSVEDNIQSNDISSCTDFENSSNLMIGNKAKDCSLNDRQDATINCSENNTRTKHSSDLMNDFTRELCSYESPTSSAYISPPKETRTESDIVNVETLSEGSDVDIVGENMVDSFLGLPPYRTSRGRLKLHGSHDKVDAESTERARLERESDRETQEEIDVTGLSETDSVVEYVGEEQRRITIATDSSDSDTDSYIEVLNHESDHYIDVLGNSEEEDDDDDDIVIGAEETVTNQFGNRRELTIDTDIDSTDLDYHCDTDDNINVEDKKSASKNKVLPVLSDRDSDTTELDYSLDEIDTADNYADFQTSQDEGMTVQASEEEASLRKNHNSSTSTTGKELPCDGVNANVHMQPRTPSSDSPCLLASTVLADASSAVESSTSFGAMTNPINGSSSTLLEDGTSSNRAEELLLTRNSPNVPLTAKKSATISRSEITGDESASSEDETKKEEVKDTIRSKLYKPQIANRKSSTNDMNCGAVTSAHSQVVNDSNTNNNNSTLTENRAVGAATSNTTSLPVSSGLIWTSNPLFEPRNPVFNSNLTTGHTDNAGPDYISSVFEPSSPLFQPSPDYVYDEFSPAVSGSSEDNFVPED